MVADGGFGGDESARVDAGGAAGEKEGHQDVGVHAESGWGDGVGDDEVEAVVVARVVVVVAAAAAMSMPIMGSKPYCRRWY